MGKEKPKVMNMSSKNIGRLGATIFIILVLVALGMRNRFAGSVEAQEQPADSSSSDLFSPAQSSVPEQEREPNRLIHEKSPYFLQHARNPVDWYPWVESTRLAGCTVRPDHYADAVEGV